jgi:hypothetical protein
VWSKAGRNLEGLHAVGVIYSKISVHLCVKLCFAVIIIHFISWVMMYMMHAYLCYEYVCNFALQSVVLCFNWYHNYYQSNRVELLLEMKMLQYGIRVDDKRSL